MQGSRSEELVGFLKPGCGGGGGRGAGGMVGGAARHTGEEDVECFLPFGAQGRWGQCAVITSPST